MLNATSLAGQIVLITGASRGIGRSIALRLAREKPEHIIVGYCLNRAAALETVGELESLAVPASAVAADVGRRESVEEMFEGVRERFGALDVFISNAARAAFRTGMDLSSRSWQKTMEINAGGFLYGCQMAAGLMESRGGRIVAISSLGAHRYSPGYLALGAAKAALETVARYLAVELAPRGINVNVVCGGLIETESVMQHPDYHALKEQVVARTPAARVGRPEDLAGIVAFLLTPEAQWIRGQVLTADGGFSLMN